MFILSARTSEINSPKSNYAPMHFYFRCLGGGYPAVQGGGGSRDVGGGDPAV